MWSKTETFMWSTVTIFYFFFNFSSCDLHMHIPMAAMQITFSWFIDKYFRTFKMANFKESLETVNLEIQNFSGLLWLVNNKSSVKWWTQLKLMLFQSQKAYNPCWFYHYRRSLKEVIWGNMTMRSKSHLLYI